MYMNKKIILIMLFAYTFTLVAAQKCLQNPDEYEYECEESPSSKYSTCDYHKEQSPRKKPSIQDLYNFLCEQINFLNESTSLTVKERTFIKAKVNFIRSMLKINP